MLFRELAYRALAAVQILPLRIVLFYQSQFPLPIPFLKLLFSNYGGVNIFKDFVVNKQMHVITSCEPAMDLVLMLVHSPHQIIRQTDVERSVSLASQDVYEECLQHSLSSCHPLTLSEGFQNHDSICQGQK